MVQEAKSLSFSFYVLKYTGFLKEHALDFFCNPENASPTSEDAQQLYETVKLQGVNIKKKYISNFQYEFRAIPSYDFVAVVPIEAEKNYFRFLQLGDDLRNALIKGTFDAVDKALRQMSPSERKTSLTACAIGGYFYFKRTIKPTQFGVMSQAVKRALDKLA
ncbi:hypothetical protein DSO57_1013955 [Entomophthora muscae]|uniref:Uncharacterized protein n=1 Tax=Entomophthora muscae TaxID=34485 RepID=A0ACC2S7F9_9FUNG|nr:hypothetical protein DSO57_1013955 [Entomophthora muscae]